MLNGVLNTYLYLYSLKLLSFQHDHLPRTLFYKAQKPFNSNLPQFYHSGTHLTLHFRFRPYQQKIELIILIFRSCLHKSIRHPTLIHQLILKQGEDTTKTLEQFTKAI